MGIFNRLIPQQQYNPVDMSTKPVYIDDMFDPFFNQEARAYLRQKYDGMSPTLTGVAELVENTIRPNEGEYGILGPGMGFLSTFGRTMDKADDIPLGLITEGANALAGDEAHLPLGQILLHDKNYTGNQAFASVYNIPQRATGVHFTPEDFTGIWNVPATTLELITDPGWGGSRLAREFAPQLKGVDSSRVLEQMGTMNASTRVGAVGQLLSNYDDFMVAKVRGVMVPDWLKDSVVSGLKSALVSPSTESYVNTALKGDGGDLGGYDEGGIDPTTMYKEAQAASEEASQIDAMVDDIDIAVKHPTEEMLNDTGKVLQEEQKVLTAKGLSDARIEAIKKSFGGCQPYDLVPIINNDRIDIRLRTEAQRVLRYKADPAVAQLLVDTSTDEGKNLLAALQKDFPKIKKSSDLNRVHKKNFRGVIRDLREQRNYNIGEALEGHTHRFPMYISDDSRTKYDVIYKKRLAELDNRLAKGGWETFKPDFNFATPKEIRAAGGEDVFVKNIAEARDNIEIPANREDFMKSLRYALENDDWSVFDKTRNLDITHHHTQMNIKRAILKGLGVNEDEMTSLLEGRAKQRADANPTFYITPHNINKSEITAVRNYLKATLATPMQEFAKLPDEEFRAVIDNFLDLSGYKDREVAYKQIKRYLKTADIDTLELYLQTHLKRDIDYAKDHTEAWHSFDKIIKSFEDASTYNLDNYGIVDGWTQEFKPSGVGLIKNKSSSVGSGRIYDVGENGQVIPQGKDATDSPALDGTSYRSGDFRLIDKESRKGQYSHFASGVNAKFVPAKEVLKVGEDGKYTSDSVNDWYDNLKKLKAEYSSRTYTVHTRNGDIVHDVPAMSDYFELGISQGHLEDVVPKKLIRQRAGELLNDNALKILPDPDERTAKTIKLTDGTEIHTYCKITDTASKINGSPLKDLDNAIMRSLETKVDVYNIPVKGQTTRKGTQKYVSEYHLPGDGSVPPAGATVYHLTYIDSDKLSAFKRWTATANSTVTLPKVEVPKGKKPEVTPEMREAFLAREAKRPKTGQVESYDGEDLTNFGKSSSKDFFPRQNTFTVPAKEANAPKKLFIEDQRVWDGAVDSTKQTPLPDVVRKIDTRIDQLSKQRNKYIYEATSRLTDSTMSQILEMELKKGESTYTKTVEVASNIYKMYGLTNDEIEKIFTNYKIPENYSVAGGGSVNHIYRGIIQDAWDFAIKDGGTTVTLPRMMDDVLKGNEEYTKIVDEIQTLNKAKDDLIKTDMEITNASYANTPAPPRQELSPNWVKPTDDDYLDTARNTFESKFAHDIMFIQADTKGVKKDYFQSYYGTDEQGLVQTLERDLTNAIKELPPEEFVKEIEAPQDNAQIIVQDALEQASPLTAELKAQGVKDSEIKKAVPPAEYDLYKHLDRAVAVSRGTASPELLKEINRTSAESKLIASTAKNTALTSDQLKFRQGVRHAERLAGDTVKGTDFVQSFFGTEGMYAVRLTDNNEGIVNAMLNNAKKVNDICGKEIIRTGTTTLEGQEYVRMWIDVENQNIVPDVMKHYDELSKAEFDDLVFLKGYDDGLHLDIQPEVDKFLGGVQDGIRSQYRKLGIEYNESTPYIHRAVLRNEETKKFLGQIYDYDDSDKFSDNITAIVERFSNEPQFAKAARGELGTIALGKRLRGDFFGFKNNDFYYLENNAVTYAEDAFSTGVYANTKLQSLKNFVDNDNFKVRTRFESPEHLYQTLHLGQGNLHNLRLMAIEYDANGKYKGFKEYSKNLAGCREAFKNADTVLLPSNAISSLDKAFRYSRRMDNALYAFMQRHLILPWKVGVLCNPAYIVGNVGDALTKQIASIGSKYGESAEEAAASFLKARNEYAKLANSYGDTFEQFLSDCKKYNVRLSPEDQVPSLALSSPAFRQKFTKWLKGELTAVVDNEQVKIGCKVGPDQKRTMYYIAIQSSVGADNIQDLKDLKEQLGVKTYGGTQNAFDRIIQGSVNYDATNPKTWGLEENPYSRGILGISENVEQDMRGTCIVNDLLHNGFDFEVGHPKGTKPFNVSLDEATSMMYDANFNYDAMNDFTDTVGKAIPFPTFFLKNFGYWMEYFLNHPNRVHKMVKLQEGLWQGEDESDEFVAEAKGRGALPMSALGNPVEGYFKPTPFQSMFSAFNTLNNPIENLSYRTNPIISGAVNGITKGKFSNPDDVKYRPYNTNPYQRNIKATDPDFNLESFYLHNANPHERQISTFLRTPNKVREGTAQASDFFPSLFQPKFGKRK